MHMTKILSWVMLFGVQIVRALPAPDIAEPKLEDRQSGTYITNTITVGNGNPHQNTFQKQVSQNVACGTAQTCSAAVTQEHTIGYTESAGLNVGWISAGFSVEESYTDGQTYTCGGNAGETVCVWRTYQVTAYTVAPQTCYYFDGVSSQCTTGNSTVIYSPNTCQNGGFYCVTGSACRAENQGYYVYSGPAGGPSC